MTACDNSTKLCPNYSFCPQSATPSSPSTCQSCPESCLSCISTELCELCAPGYIYETSGSCTPLCGKKISFEHFCNEGTPEICSPFRNVITACVCGTARNCAMCGGASKCHSCLTGYVLNENGSCDSCQIGSQQIGEHCFGTGNEHEMPDWQMALIIFVSLEVIWAILGFSSFFIVRKVIKVKEIKAQMKEGAGIIEGDDDKECHEKAE